VIESHPAGYRLAVPPGAVDVMAFEELAAQGRRALADGDAAQAARVLRDALLAWRGQPLADAAGSDLAEATAARLTELLQRPGGPDRGRPGPRRGSQPGR